MIGYYNLNSIYKYGRWLLANPINLKVLAILIKIVDKSLQLSNFFLKIRKQLFPLENVHPDLYFHIFRLENVSNS